MLMRPCFFCEHCAALGDFGDIVFADFTQYTIGLRKEISLDKSNTPGWTEDMMDHRVTLRIDGQGSWDKVLTPPNSADTQSPFITLAERSWAQCREGARNLSWLCIGRFLLFSWPSCFVQPWMAGGHYSF